MRCFLAVPVEEPALGEAQRLLALAGERIGSVRWVRPEGLHVTVHFFGSIEVAQASVALDALRPVVESSQRFEVVLDRLGTFPERGRPRVLWLGSLHESSNLAELASRCRDGLRPEGFAVDDRPFTTHVTLGRPRDGWGKEEADQWTLLQTELTRLAFHAERMVLYESVAAAGGTRYVSRAELGLAT